MRFKGFTEDWEQRKLGEIYVERNERGDETLEILSVSIHHGVSNSELDTETLGKSIRRSEDKSLYKHVYYGDLVFNMMRAWQGAIGVVKSEGMVSPAYVSAIPDDRVFPEFMDYCLRRERVIGQINNLSYGVTDFRKRLYWDSFTRVCITIPSVDEQQKITSVLRQVDNLITLHQRKLVKLNSVKKSMMEKMFPKNGKRVPEIRFAGFTDDWEQRKLGEISDKVTRKNQDVAVEEAFTNSAEFGIISQRDFFDKDIANAENIDGYYVVEPDDFVYNPRISTTAPFGPIKRNKLERTGAMSPLYYVFRPHDIDLSYLEWFFQTTCWHAFMRFNGNSGARSDRFAITDKIFNEMPISMPQDIEEQKKIGAFLTELESLITLHQSKLMKLVKIKQSMLESMFV